jgi:hypothetical protein
MEIQIPQIKTHCPWTQRPEHLPGWRAKGNLKEAQNRIYTNYTSYQDQSDEQNKITDRGN